jgi:trimeric autotransporter adhesin
MAATLGPFPVFRAFTADGAPAAGYLLHSFAAGTSTPQALYADDGVTPLDNPVELDANGQANIRYGALAYKLTLTDPDGAVQQGWPVDNVTTSNQALYVNYTAPFTGAVARTLDEKLSELISPKDVGATGDGIVDDTVPMSSLTAALVSGGLGIVPTATRTAYLTHQPAFLTVNHHDYATIGTDDQVTNGTFAGAPATGWTLANFTSLNPGISHAAGTVGSAARAVPVTPFTQYVLEITLTTTTAGSIDFTMAGTTIFETGVQYAFPVLGSTTFKINWLSQTDTGSETLNIVTDTLWAGTISSIKLLKVEEETQFEHIIVASDDAAMRIPQGLKFGRYNAGNIGIGDRQTLGLNGASGAWNIAIGPRAMASNQSGIENVAVGAFALQYNDANYNTGVGYSALKYNTLGQDLAAVGFKALNYNTTGSRSSALGTRAGFQNTSGNDGMFIGYQSGYNTKTSSYNTFIGSQAGLNLTGASNTHIGGLAGQLNVDSNITYAYNYTTAIGAETKPYGNHALAIGFQAIVGADGAPAAQATSIGALSKAVLDETLALGYNAQATGGIRNIAIGKDSAASAAGGQAMAVGFLANAAGTGMSSIGAQAGTGQTGSSCTFLGYTAGYAVQNFNNITCLGANTAVTGANQVQLGDSSTTTYAYGAVQNRSDARDKANVQDTSLGLDFIQALRPVDFRWDYRSDYVETVTRERKVKVPSSLVDEFGRAILMDAVETYEERVQVPADGSKKRGRFHHGLVAQEVAEVIKASGLDFGGFQDHKVSGGEDVLSIGYTELIAPLIKAVQELSAKVERLEKSA